MEKQDNHQKNSKKNSKRENVVSNVVSNHEKEDNYYYGNFNQDQYQEKWGIFCPIYLSMVRIRG